MLNDRSAGLPYAGNDIDHAIRETRFLENFRETQQSKAGGFRRLDHNGVPASNRRRNFPGRHEQREIPRDNLANHSKRFRGAVGEGILQLVSPAGGTNLPSMTMPYRGAILMYSEVSGAGA